MSSLHMQQPPFPFSEVIVSAFAALGLAIFLSPIALFNTFVITGHAHFIAAWFYQWRAGKMTLGFVSSLLFLAFGTAAFTATVSLDWQVAVAGTLFVAHHMFDEFRLLGYTMSWRRLFEISIPAFLFEAIFLATIFGSNVGTLISGVLAVCATVVTLWGIVQLVRNGMADQFTGYALLFSVPLVYLFFNTDAVTPQALIGTLIMYHYIKWYLYSFRRIPAGQQRRTYLKHMVVINLIVGVIFLASIWSVKTAFLGAWFIPPVFYFMTIMHILSSFLQFGFRAQPFSALVRS